MRRGGRIVPLNVKIFLGFNYFALALSSLANVMILYRVPMPPHATNIFIAEIAFLTLLFATLVTLAGFRRQNWARWVYLILTLPLIAFYLYLQIGYLQRNGLDGRAARGWSQIILQASSFYFIFTGDAVAWFHKRRDDVTVF